MEAVDPVHSDFSYCLEGSKAAWYNIASAYTLLAVEQYGLGACWVHIRNRMGQQETSDQEIRSLLGVPDGYSVLNLVAIGEKGEEKRPYTDADLHTENVHYEKY